MKRTRGFLAITLIIAFGVAFYALIAYRDQEPKPVPQETNDEVSKLIVRNLESDYPNSPREVVRFYSRIMQSYYELDYTEEELLKLVSQSRILFSEELLKENTEESYIEELKTEIESYKKLEQTIIDFKVAEVSQIEYFYEDEDEFAKVFAIYTLKNKNGSSKVYEDYILRKDEEGYWKILGWRITPESERKK